MGSLDSGLSIIYAPHKESKTGDVSGARSIRCSREQGLVSEVRRTKFGEMLVASAVCICEVFSWFLTIVFMLSHGQNEVFSFAERFKSDSALKSLGSQQAFNNC